jgi:hypothetical protein
LDIGYSSEIGHREPGLERCLNMKRFKTTAGFRPALAFVMFLFLLVGPAGAQTVARCGQGWLEKIGGYPVLHLKGTYYEMGFQHGALLKKHVQQNMDFLLRKKGDEALAQLGPIKLKPVTVLSAIVAIQQKHVPQKFKDELQGLAAGAQVPLKDAQLTNFIPELFHCSGFALMNSATKDGTLYHGRVLDYGIDLGLQDHAVIIVAEPKGGIPFVNISYAGFIGSVSGMNARHVSIGELGGRGLGHWAGVPMAFLVREALERGKNLDAAISVFRDNKRTCQYYYVLADGAANRAAGMEASWNRFELIPVGKAHPQLPTAVKDCSLLSVGDRYQELVRRVQKGHGKFTAETAIRLMDRPVAMKSNLHNVLFEPKTTRFWVANASHEGRPASTQKYHAFQLSKLLKRKPDMTSPVIKLVSKE